MTQTLAPNRIIFGTRIACAAGLAATMLHQMNVTVIDLQHAAHIRVADGVIFGSS